MNIKKLIRNIAAVSLIEIMMIFAIIGVVTTACMGLSKPKNEYMKKIKVYSAYVMLEQAAKTIANEGHIDFTTDINTCKSRNDSNVCLDYSADQKSLPGFSNQLPKVSQRAALANSEVDPGLSATAYANAVIREKVQFLYLQNGLCQRIASALKLNDSGVNCSTNTSASGLIEAAYPASFYGTMPQLYLPNGQVIYMNKNLFNDLRNDSDVLQEVVPATSRGWGYNTSLELERDAVGGSNYNIANWVGDFDGYTDSLLLNIPNETKLALIHRFRTLYANFSSYNNRNFVNYLAQMYQKNKDYFIIFVDTDCKKATQSDKSCGPDRLNEDIFAFRMYRDGTVIPDYKSGFPVDLLKAKILVRPNGSTSYTTYSLAYSTVPLVHALCYANLLGTYSSTYSNDHMGICYNNSVTRNPLAGCLTEMDETKCKVILNKPSFIMR